MKAKLLLRAGLLASLTGCFQAQAQAPNSNVIMYIGDGFGLAPKTAARMAMGMNANVTILDRSLDRLKYLDEVYGKYLYEVELEDVDGIEWEVELDALTGHVLKNHPDT